MSRLIVKNIPKQITAEKLKSLFSSKGVVTDCQLKYDKKGNFRQFAFVGFKTEEEALRAKTFFDQTYVGTSKIVVELCKDLGSTLSIKERKKLKLKENKSTKKVIKEGESDVDKRDPFDELKDDKEFSEFLKLQRNVGTESKQIWSNDVNDESQKMCDTNTIQKKKQKVEVVVEDVKKQKFSFTIVIRGLPYKCTKSKIRTFLTPLKPVSIRLPPKIKGIAYVSFNSEQELKKSLIKHRGFLEGHRVEIHRYSEKAIEEEEKSEKKSKSEDKIYEPADEDVSESGRIFIRNLCYSCTEDDLEKLFSKYGPLSEVNLPIDSFTKKLKGFGFICFMFPEHAIKAFAELDGTIFQGRTLHLIPAKSKPEKKDTPSMVHGSSFKQQKDEKKKEDASSSHNWNTLFLGANAVADLMSEKYGVEKSKLIADKDSRESVAVRMALGETQLVMETKKFLTANGVDIDAFRESQSTRSKTVILAKNLPKDTKVEELEQLFSKHGLVNRVLLPPSGITAVIEMQEEREAKNAFKNLAYINFKHYPLYLEWAPSNVFKIGSLDKNISVETSDQQKDQKVEEEEKPEEDTTIFVKNLNFKTDEEGLRNHFEKCGKVYKVTIPRKRHPDGSRLPIGYGFVQFMFKKSATKAMKELQNRILDDHALQLKLSQQSTRFVMFDGHNELLSFYSSQKRFEKKRVIEKQAGTKILIRNIPFEATVKDVKELFSAFGDLKSVRLPSKLSGVGSHRGFGFAEFMTKSAAKKAFESLGESTHLYGRRLALEWALDTSDDLESRKRDAANSISNLVRGPNKKKLKKSDLLNELDTADAQLSD